MNKEQLELPKEKLRLLFSDILKGYCFSSYKNKSINIKHLTYLDISDFDIKYNSYLEDAKKNGVPTTEEREKILIEEGSWFDAKNKSIQDYKLFITSMKETKAKLFRQIEIEQINRTIKETEEKLQTLEEEKLQLLQCTAEIFAQKKITEYQIFKSTFCNDKLLFNEEEYDSLSDAELVFLANLYNNKLMYFNEKNFRRVALSNFFLNSFYLCDNNPFTFYGKPVIQLTLFQIEIFSHAVYFKHILSNSQSKPPPHIMENPDLLIDWHNSSQAVKE
ncbi:MAG: hypothetical protein AABY22_06155, partial [Nanoarchaeota archaeon]